MPTRDEKNRIRDLYRGKFDDAPPILMMTMGALEQGRVSEEQAWLLCEQAAVSGKHLRFIPIPANIDL
jgi:hypothetical protein